MNDAPWSAGELYTRANEGCRLAAYDDATGEPVPKGASCTGTLTIGFGHTGGDVAPGDSWSQARCDGVFAIDYAGARFAAKPVLGGDAWRALDAPRRYALTDISFEIGGRGLARFVKMLAAVRAGDWQAAHDECLASELPRGRAAKNATILLTGEMPAG